MKMTAQTVVALDSTVAAPRLPRAVWLPPPPNAPARSAALPLCSRTTMIRITQTMMWTAYRMNSTGLRLPRMSSERAS
jgi:hypothetical protein